MEPVPCPTILLVQSDQFLNRLILTKNKHCRRQLCTPLWYSCIPVERGPGQPCQLCPERQSTRNIIHFYWPKTARNFIPSIIPAEKLQSMLIAFSLLTYHTAFPDSFFPLSVSLFPFHPLSCIPCCCSHCLKSHQYYFLSVHPQQTNSTMRYKAQKSTI